MLSNFLKKKKKKKKINIFTVVRFFKLVKIKKNNNK